MADLEFFSLDEQITTEKKVKKKRGKTSKKKQKEQKEQKEQEHQPILEDDFNQRKKYYKKKIFFSKNNEVKSFIQDGKIQIINKKKFYQDALDKLEKRPVV